MVGITNVYKISIQVSRSADIIPRSVYALHTDRDNHNEQNSKNCTAVKSMEYM